MLDFSLSGRSSRLSFFLVEAGYGLVTLVPVIAVFVKCAAEGLPLADMQRQTGPVLSLAILVLAWPRLALACRRARDAGLGMWIAYSYVGLLTLNGLMISYGQFRGDISLGSSAAAGFAVWGLWGFLQFRGSVDEALLHDDEVETFGARAPVPVPSPPGGLSSMSGDQLLARARALKEADGQPEPEPRTTSSRGSGGVAPRGFGKRNQSAFGRR